MSIDTTDIAALTGRWRRQFDSIPGPRLQASGIPAAAEHLLVHLRAAIAPHERRVAAETLLVSASTTALPVVGSPRLISMRIQQQFAQAYAALLLLEETWADVVAGIEDTT